MGSSKNRPAVLWRYVITHHGRLAPHIANGVCSLVVCKPRIRRYAKPGEWVLAFASAAVSKGNLLVQYVMRISDNPLFESYCRDHIGVRRDAIYRFDSNANGEWFDNGYADHSPSKGGNGPKDKGGAHALTSTEFVHFGAQPRNLIFELTPFCDQIGLRAEDVVEELRHRSQGQSKYCSQQAFEVFLAWVGGLQKDREAPPHHFPLPKRGIALTRADNCR